jgi:class 3 adenylate cyclase/tetratricopeptide (TPR) repeat protein
MKCPRCQSENPGKRKFCRECGTKLPVICFKCQTENLPTDKFCGECGQQLEEPLPKTKPTTAPPSERKHVTVLYSDMSGYTALTEKLDPEETREIMGRIFGEISKVVARYEGFIEKFIGDAVMALFGVPASHEDDPVRAIKASREIHDAVSSLSSQFEKKIGKLLCMHTGVCTGLVVTGEVNLEKGTHGVLGDTINTAARLSDLAKPDEIVVSPDTYHQAEGYFNFEPLDAVTLKGKTELVRPYKVLSPKEVPTKTHRLSGLRADLIGREAEMARLQEAVQNLKLGRGSIFSIIGDAGTGKSRLIEEFKNTLDLKTIQWCEGHAYPYSQNIPNFPLIDLLSRGWRIREGDSPELVRKKVAAGAGSLISDRSDLIPYLGNLYSLRYPEIENVSPEYWKLRLHEAVQVILSALNRRGPSIICIEDLQWADPSSVELLRNILAASPLPAIFLCIYRPEFTLFSSRQISTLESHQEIRLHDLSAPEAQTMVESLLKTDSVPAELKKFIRVNVEGNPFYLEEVINSLLETAVLVREDGQWKLTKPLIRANIPSTVQGLISARLDRLETEDKRILQEASVIGRAFLYEILKRITELKDRIDTSLMDLERLDLIRTKTFQADLEYVFKHALTQEVVYNGLLRKKRQNIHEKIGLVIEEIFQERLPEFYESLAYHFGHSRYTLKAVDYLIRSGEKSLKRYALEESNFYFRDAFDLLSNMVSKTIEDEKLLIELFLKWSYVHHSRADYIGLINLLKAHETFIEIHANRDQLAMLYGWLGWALARRHTLLEGYEYLRKALRIAEECRNIRTIGYCCTWLTWVCADRGFLDEAIDFGERAREISYRFESDQDMFRLAFGGSAYAHWFRGDTKKVTEFGQLLLVYGNKHSDVRCITMHYIAMGWGFSLEGDTVSAIESSKNAVQLSPDPVFSHGAKTILGMCYLSIGQLKEAQTVLDEVVEFSNKFGYEWAGAISLAFKGVALIAQGKLKQGVSIYKNALRALFESKSLYRFAVGNHLMGRVYSKIAQGGGEKRDFSFLMRNIGFLVKTLPFAQKKAEEHFNKAIEVAKEIGAKGILGQAYMDLGQLHMAKGRTSKARKCIADAIEAFEKCEAVVLLNQAREVLAALG